MVLWKVTVGTRVFHGWLSYVKARRFTWQVATSHREASLRKWFTIVSGAYKRNIRSAAHARKARLLRGMKAFKVLRAGKQSKASTYDSSSSTTTHTPLSPLPLFPPSPSRSHSDPNEDLSYRTHFNAWLAPITSRSTTSTTHFITHSTTTALRRWLAYSHQARARSVLLSAGRQRRKAIELRHLASSTATSKFHDSQLTIATRLYYRRVTQRALRTLRDSAYYRVLCEDAAPQHLTSSRLHKGFPRG